MKFKNVELHNIEEVIKVKGQGYLLSRLDPVTRKKVTFTTAERSFNNCGVEIRFNLTGNQAEVILKREKSSGEVLPYGTAEIYYGDFQAPYTETPIMVENKSKNIIIKKDQLEIIKRKAKKITGNFSTDLIRILLPYDCNNYLVDIKGEIIPPEPGQIPDKKILCYGSSITHGGSANHPAESYTFKLAQLLNYDLINKGFAGNARMEKAMADYISSLDWDLAILEMGINIIDEWNIEEFKNKTSYFIEKIALKNEDKLVICTDLFRNHRDYNGNKKIMEFRQIIKDNVNNLNFKNLKYISGLDLLQDRRGLSADFTHPSTYGMDQIALNFYNFIKVYL